MEVGDPVEIVDAPVGRALPVGHRGTVLGDHEARERVGVVEVAEQRAERGRMDLPAHRRLVATADALALEGTDELAGVEVDAEVVDGRRDQLHVAGEHLGPVPAEPLGRVLRVTAAADRVGVPPVLPLIDDALAIEGER